MLMHNLIISFGNFYGSDYGSVGWVVTSGTGGPEFNLDSDKILSRTNVLLKKLK